MTKYWLYLEPFVFVFRKKENVLFYNSLSGDYFHMENKGIIKKIVSELTNPLAMYCIEIDDYQFQSDAFRKFVDLLRSNYMGEIIDKSLADKKPISLYPKATVMKSKEHLLQEGNIGNNVLSYLNELTIQITDRCDLDCKYCNIVNKQFLACMAKNSNELSIETIKKVLMSIQYSSVSKINIKGGDILLYSNYDELIPILKQYSQYGYIFIFNYKQLVNGGHSYIKQLLKLRGLNNITLKIQVVGRINQIAFENILKTIMEVDLPVEYELIIFNQQQYNDADSFCNKTIKTDFVIKPFIIQGSRLISDILIDEKSIFSQIHSKKDIFRRQILNSNDFGYLQMNADGNVFANINMPKLGNIKRSFLSELIQKELKNGKSWFRIRNQLPCKNCVYQWLCPPPSNYELATNKFDLCNLIK